MGFCGRLLESLIPLTQTVHSYHSTFFGLRILGDIVFYRHIAPLEQRGLFATILKILKSCKS